MNIIVCIKQILDPQIPPSRFKVDLELGCAIPPEGIPPVISPYDAQAIELGLRLKEKHGCRVTVLTVGTQEVQNAIRHALSMGADEGIVLTDEAFEGSDSFSIAYILTKAIQKVGDYNLILCGRQAADWDEGLVGSIIAENLSLPLVSLAKDIEVIGGELRVKRMTFEGYQLYAVPTPALVTVSNEVGQPRLPSAWGIITAARKQIPTWNASEINANSSHIGTLAARRKLVKLLLPSRERKCKIIEGDTGAEAAIKLAERLREERII